MMTKTESVKYAVWATDTKGKTRPISLEAKTLEKGREYLKTFLADDYYSVEFSNLHLRKIVRTTKTTIVK